MRKHGGELSVDLQRVRTDVHQDLGLKSLVQTPKHLLTESTKDVTGKGQKSESLFEDSPPRDCQGVFC